MYRVLVKSRLDQVVETMRCDISRDISVKINSVNDRIDGISEVRFSAGF